MSASPRIMGVVNVTPDSFSDGGIYATERTAIDHAMALADQGADILDIGGESTRPGAAPVLQGDELSRVIPVIRGLRRAGVTIPISIDTMKSRIARAAVEAGATIVNDVSAGLHDSAMLDVVAELGVPYIAMHMLGTPPTMQENPTYTNVVEDVHTFLSQRVSEGRLRGIADVWVDVGIGFGKSLEHNLELLRNLHRFTDLGPTVLGISRKGFLGALTGVQGAADRDAVTMVAHGLLMHHGCSVLRVHNVVMAKQLVSLAKVLAD
jgi:dihydropteroate synthase